VDLRARLILATPVPRYRLEADAIADRFPCQLSLFAEGVAQRLDGWSPRPERDAGDRRVPLSSKGSTAARGSAGGELVLVELEQVVGGGQQPPFGPDGRPAAA
jgi:hypothetical protein